MAFKTAKSYTENLYGNFFTLRDDNDFADVIFLYNNEDEVLVADTHYIKSDEYSGYVHCCERGCPACEKQLRIQTKLFIPIINITEGTVVQFWDRTPRMLPQLSKELFAIVPDPINYIWRVTRHGKPKDFNTYYTITCMGAIKKPDGTSWYDVPSILLNNNITLPESYNLVCRDVTSVELRDMLSGGSSTNSNSIPEYTPTPRVSTAPSTIAPPESVAELPDSDDFDDDVDYEELGSGDVTF